MQDLEELLVLGPSCGYHMRTPQLQCSQACVSLDSQTGKLSCKPARGLAIVLYWLNAARC